MQPIEAKTKNARAAKPTENGVQPPKTRASASKSVARPAVSRATANRANAKPRGASRVQAPEGASRVQAPEGSPLKLNWSRKPRTGTGVDWASTGGDPLVGENLSDTSHFEPLHPPIPHTEPMAPPISSIHESTTVGLLTTLCKRQSDQESRQSDQSRVAVDTVD